MTLILHNFKSQYRSADKTEKSQLLDQFCQTTRMHRKSAIRLLNKKTNPHQCKKPGRRPAYTSDELLNVLRQIGLSSDQICPQRLKAILPEWLPFFEKHYGNVSEQTKAQLDSISSATISRLLKPYRAHRKLCTTKPGSLLKTQIPIKTNQWDESLPGFMEADTVAHCGETLSGNFMWSLTMTDIATGWTENSAIWNKGSLGVIQAIKAIQTNLPFTLKGFDCDNGSEFLNYHLIRYFAENAIQLTRARPYHKNDNAHVEQKNWTHVRQLLGYHRYDNPRLVTLVNLLYHKEISYFNNHFLPTFKLLHKYRNGSRIVKKHSRPETPYHRIIRSPHINPSVKIKLAAFHASLDPFDLQANIQRKLKAVYQIVNLNSKQKRKAI